MPEPSDGAESPTISGPSCGPKAAGNPSSAIPHFPSLEILEETAPGTGGMGRVYRARDTRLDRIVAVKTVRDDMLTPQGRAFFEREARAAARLNHPNIVKIHGFNPDHSPPYYVMEFVEGRTLDEVCSGRPVGFVVEILEKVARSLTYAHAKGVVHRDIKPANILVDDRHEPHLTDFGLAQQWDETAFPTGVRGPAVAGTPAFLAPELYAQGAAAGPTADIFALGVTMYRLLTGRYPFTGKTREEVRESVLGGDPPLLQELSTQVPEPLQRICLKAIERDPDMRYPSAEALADDLRRFREGREVFARPTRYEAELQGKLRNHVTEIQLWFEHHLIDVREMDRLARPYRQLLAAEFPWHDLARRYPWETAALRLGGWLVVVGTVLWPAFYWGRLAQHDRLLAIGLPALALNLVGWFFHRRRGRSTAFIFLSLGALLLPLFTGVLLTEYHWLRFPQSEARELAGREAAHDRPLGGADPAESPVFAPTNMQLTLSVGLFLAHTIGLLRVTRVRAFAVWTGLGVYALFTAILLLMGLREWLEASRLAKIVLCYAGLALAFLGVSRVLDWRGRAEWAAVFYVFFPVPLVYCLTRLAEYGASEWLEARGDSYQETVCLWLMANGAAYFGAALWSGRARQSHIRFWGDFFMLLVPASLLIPVDYLWRRGFGYALCRIGGEPVTTYELLSLALSAAFVIAGTHMRRYTFALSGLAGVAAFLFLATTAHFRNYLSWPLALAITGGVAMAAAVVLVTLKARKHPHRAL